MEVLTYLGLAGLCLCVAFGALWLFSWADRSRTSPHSTGEISASFLFDGSELVHATKEANDILKEAGSISGSEWRHVHRSLRLRFPDLPNNAEAAFAMAPATIHSVRENDSAELTLSAVRGRLRLCLQDNAPHSVADRHLRFRHGQILRRMNSAAALYSDPLWLLNSDGVLEWANPAYHKLRETIEHKAGSSLISELEFEMPDGRNSFSKRIMIQGSEQGESSWFNVTKTIAEDGINLNFATNIDSLIEAEISQRKFVQTLTKTFAQLSAGLAIFDKERQLALFNPALIDLFALPADFLSARPTLVTFFDRLRDSRMMPEPKDYVNWRQQITDLVIASVDGRFQETWTLPSGLTYRVTGRPHPDGAIALLFEDISAEISLTRRFRSQLNQSQTILDSLDEAIVVFSATGNMTSSNKPYRELWKVDPDSSFANVTLNDALRDWSTIAGPDPLWARLREYFSDPDDRSEWFADITMKSGTPIECRVSPLAGGAMLVGFRLRPVIEPRNTPKQQASDHS